jgi:hypothetical protein
LSIVARAVAAGALTVAQLAQILADLPADLPIWSVRIGGGGTGLHRYPAICAGAAGNRPFLQVLSYTTEPETAPLMATGAFLAELRIHADRHGRADWPVVIAAIGGGRDWFPITAVGNRQGRNMIVSVVDAPTY